MTSFSKQNSVPIIVQVYLFITYNKELHNIQVNPWKTPCPLLLIFSFVYFSASCSIHWMSSLLKRPLSLVMVILFSSPVLLSTSETLKMPLASSKVTSVWGMPGGQKVCLWVQTCLNLMHSIWKQLLKMKNFRAKSTMKKNRRFFF